MVKIKKPSKKRKEKVSGNALQNRDKEALGVSGNVKQGVMNSTRVQKTEHACMVEAHESTRKRLESVPKDHECHIASKGDNSMAHCILAHKYATSDSGCESSSGQGMEEARNDTSLALGQSEDQKRRVLLEARRDERKVHFATLMDISHLQNAELEPTFQKYKERVVLRGDIVKDDSGACAVFTE